MRIDKPVDLNLLDEALPVHEALAAFDTAHDTSGAIASFIGKVRPDDDIEALELTDYYPLTRTTMLDFAVEAMQRFPLDGLLAWHRRGVLRPGEPIVLVAAAARHRRGAFAAVDFMMDHLKAKTWFWKREKRGEDWRWIEPRDADRADLARWTVD